MILQAIKDNISMSIQLRGVLAATLLLLLPAMGARAQVVDDPLHGACTGTGSATCGADNGTLTPLTDLTAGPLTGFGFQASPAPQTGNLDIVVLIPTVVDTGISASVTGTDITGSDSLHLFSTTKFTSGDLATYLGISMASPNNPIGGFEVGKDSADTSFDVYVLNTLIGGDVLQGTSSALSDIYSISGTGVLPAGTSIVGFLENSSQGGTTATALSGQLQLQNGVPLGVLVSVPLPGTAFLFLGGLGALGWLTRRRRPTPAPMQA